MTHKGTAELFEAPAIALRKLSAQTLPANERPGPGGRPHASNWWDPARWFRVQCSVRLSAKVCVRVVGVIFRVPWRWTSQRQVSFTSPL